MSRNCQPRWDKKVAQHSYVTLSWRVKRKGGPSLSLVLERALPYSFFPHVFWASRDLFLVPHSHTAAAAAAAAAARNAHVSFWNPTDAMGHGCSILRATCGKKCLVMGFRIAVSGGHRPCWWFFVLWHVSGDGVWRIGGAQSAI
jgi:hypothetical protein